MSASTPIYLDYSATTPVDARVFEAMRPFFCQSFGNPASTNHVFGQVAGRAVEAARAQVAKLFNVSTYMGDRTQIVFTAGATESNNLAIKGIAGTPRERGRHLITQVTEHKAVLNTCKCLQQQGWDVTWLGVDDQGSVNPADVAAAITDRTALVSIMWANNETGTIQPIEQIGELCRQRGVLFHSDATQAVGKVPMDLSKVPIDLMSFTGHKIYGPKGCGGLYIRHDSGANLQPLLHGGGHECGLRSGTLNVPGIVGVGSALDLARQEMTADSLRLGGLRDQLQAELSRRLTDTRINAVEVERLPHVANISFAGVMAEELIQNLPDLAISSGSACQTGKAQASYVLLAMGIPHDVASCSVRFSLGRFTSDKDVETAISRVCSAVTHLRQHRSTRRAAHAIASV